MSDRRIPASLRQMHGTGSHTFSLSMRRMNGSGSNFISKPSRGSKNLTNAEAEAVVAKDREASQKDLFGHIAQGVFPRWTLYVQIMPEADAATYRINPFDLTKAMAACRLSVAGGGVMELNRNPESYFAEVEQAAFNPANIVPGIGFCLIKCSGRLFAYGDAHRYRLGAN
ncbi:MAG: catalase [Alistipes indistinctus]